MTTSPVAKRYHWLLVKREPDSDWEIEFGDYQKSLVKYEYDDIRLPARQKRIVSGGDTDAWIREYIRNLEK